MSGELLGGAVGAVVRAEMHRQGCTVAELAELLGVSRRSAQRRVSGHLSLSLGELEAVAWWLDVPAHELVRRGQVTGVPCGGHHVGDPGHYACQGNQSGDPS